MASAVLVSNKVKETNMSDFQAMVLCFIVFALWGVLLAIGI